MNVNLTNTKKVLNICAKIGAGTIAYSAVRNNVAAPTPVHQAMVYVATFALAGKLAQIAGDAMDSTVDDIAMFIAQNDAKIIHFT